MRTGIALLAFLAPLGCTATIDLLYNDTDGGRTPDQGDAGVADSGLQSFSFNVATPPRIVQGTTATIPISIVRNGTTAGDIQITVTGLPPGITAAPLTIPASASTGDLQITVASTVAQGSLAGVTIQGYAVGASASASANLPLFVRGPAGSLDTTFATGGRLIDLLGGTLDPIDAFVTADDSILVVGSCTTGDIFFPVASTCAARLTPNGELDTTYGNQGLATLAGFSLAEAMSWGAQGLAVMRSNGSLVVGGSVSDTAAYGIIPANGRNGTMTNFPDPIPIGATAARVAQTTLAPNDSVVMLVQATDDSGNGVNGVAKLTSTGEFDTTFGTGGFANGSFVGVTGFINDGMAVRPNGKIVILGRGAGSDSGVLSGKATGVLQLNSNGARDTTFGIDGQTWFDIGSGLYGGHKPPVILPDGRIIAMPSFAGSSILQAFKADGTGLDSTFGDNGKLSVPANPPAGYRSLSLDHQDRLLVTTCASDASEVVWRLTNKGAPDTSFGQAGWASTPPFTNSPYWSGSIAARVQEDGRIVVVTWFLQQWVVSRLWD